MRAAHLACSSGTNAREVADYYPTPYAVTQALLDAWPLEKGIVWEPACGEGHMSAVLCANGYTVDASDLRATGYGRQADFLTDEPLCPGVPIITNPPFNLAARFIERCVELQAPSFAMLLKSQYWHAAGRTALFRRCPPAYILPLTWRPDFCFGLRGGGAHYGMPLDGMDRGRN